MVSCEGSAAPASQTCGILPGFSSSRVGFPEIVELDVRAGAPFPLLPSSPAGSARVAAGEEWDGGRWGPSEEN